MLCREEEQCILRVNKCWVSCYGQVSLPWKVYFNGSGYALAVDSGFSLIERYLFFGEGGKGKDGVGLRW